MNTNVMTLAQFEIMTDEELMEVVGGVNWDRMFAGGIGAVGAIALLANPELSVPLACLYFGAGLASEGYMTYGLFTN